MGGGGDRARLGGRAPTLSEPLSDVGPLIERICGAQRTSGSGVTGTIGQFAARASTSRTDAFSTGPSSEAFDVARRLRVQWIANASIQHG